MPANLTPEYEKAERTYREAATDSERLDALREMLRAIPKHKGTEKMQADIKRRISQFRKAAVKKGASRGLDLPGEPFVWQKAQVKGAETSRGEITADTTVVAAGDWSETLLDPIGFDSMTRPKKRCMFVFNDPRLERLLHTKGFNDEGILPFTQLPDVGVYIKADVSEGSIWVGVTEDLGRGYGLEDDPQPELETYTDNAYHALVKYLPCFEGVRPVNMWAGQRAVNRFDKIPVVEGMPGLIYVGAATGNGIMKCDSLGRIVAAHYAGEEEAELYGDRRVRVSDISVKARRVEKERF